jgi:hypothetical protein
MVIAITLLSALSIYLLYLCGRINYKLGEVVQYANKLNRELDNVRTVVIKHNEVNTKLTDAVDYLIEKDSTSKYLFIGEGGDA